METALRCTLDLEHVGSRVPAALATALDRQFFREPCVGVNFAWRNPKEVLVGRS